MSEPGQEPTLEGFVPEQETPAVETPPATEVPEVPNVDEGTPAPTDPDATEASAEKAEPQGKTPEQIEADRAHWQKESQQAKEELRALREAQTVPEPEPAVTPPVTEKPAVDPSVVDSMTQDEFNEFLRDNPALATQAMLQHQEQRFIAQLDARDKARDARNQYEREATNTNKLLTNFCAKHEIPTEKLNEAFKYFEGLGVKASPSAIGEMVVDRLYGDIRSANISAVATQEAAKAAQAAKTQALTTQPAGGPTPDTGKPGSVEDLVASKFTRSKTSAAIDALFEG